MLKQGSILHGRVKVVHTGKEFKVTLPEQMLTLPAILEAIEAHFWRGFFYALRNNQDTADFHFAIALAYFQQSVLE